jgi:hypothetical protein
MPLERIFKPKSLFSMTRIGKDYDGGYLVGNKSLLESKTLITFGIKNDWSFEIDFIKANNNAKVICFDNQLNFKLLLRLLIQQLVFVFWNRKILLLLLHIRNLFNFFNFKKRVTLIKKHISYGDVLNISNKYNDIFFKIDIDGSEYRIFEELIQIKHKILGLVIEIHDIDLHKEKIINFIKQLGLELIHIHPNNFVGVDRNNDPIVIELTFEKNPDLVGNQISFPHTLDMKNNPSLKDIELVFQ